MSKTTDITFKALIIVGSATAIIWFAKTVWKDPHGSGHGRPKDFDPTVQEVIDQQQRVEDPIVSSP